MFLALTASESPVYATQRPSNVLEIALISRQVMHLGDLYQSLHGQRAIAERANCAQVSTSAWLNVKSGMNRQNT